MVEELLDVLAGDPVRLRLDADRAAQARELIDRRRRRDLATHGLGDRAVEVDLGPCTGEVVHAAVGVGGLE